jgi:hypothetical protein
MNKKGFIMTEFLTQGNKDKMRIKITDVITTNLGIFNKNFIIFG